MGLSFLLMALETLIKGTVACSGLLAVVSMACALKMRAPKEVTGRLSEKFGKLWLAAEVVLFVLVGAATLDRLFARRNLIFTALFSAFCVGCLALMSDFGTALVFFVAFLCIAFLRTGDLPSIVMITAAAGFAVWRKKRKK